MDLEFFGRLWLLFRPRPERSSMLCPLLGLLDGWYNVLMGVGVRRRGGPCVVVLGGVGVGRAGSWAWAAVVMCAGGSVVATMTGASHRKKYVSRLV